MVAGRLAAVMVATTVGSLAVPWEAYTVAAQMAACSVGILAASTGAPRVDSLADWRAAPMVECWAGGLVGRMEESTVEAEDKVQRADVLGSHLVQLVVAREGVTVVRQEGS